MARTDTTPRRIPIFILAKVYCLINPLSGEAIVTFGRASNRSVLPDSCALPFEIDIRSFTYEDQSFRFGNEEGDLVLFPLVSLGTYINIMDHEQVGKKIRKKFLKSSEIHLSG